MSQSIDLWAKQKWNFKTMGMRMSFQEAFESHNLTLEGSKTWKSTVARSSRENFLISIFFSLAFRFIVITLRELDTKRDASSEAKINLKFKQMIERWKTSVGLSELSSLKATKKTSDMKTRNIFSLPMKINRTGIFSRYLFVPSRCLLPDHPCIRNVTFQSYWYCLRHPKQRRKSDLFSLELRNFHEDWDSE